jgi:hypothetical protein
MIAQLLILLWDSKKCHSINHQKAIVLPHQSQKKKKDLLHGFSIFNRNFLRIPVFGSKMCKVEIVAFQLLPSIDLVCS